MALRPKCCRPPNPPRQAISAPRRRPGHLPYTVRIGLPQRYLWPPPSPRVVAPWLPEPPVIPQPQAPVFGEPACRALPRVKPNPYGRNILHDELRNPIGIYPYLNWDIKNFPSTSVRRRTPAHDDDDPSFRRSATDPKSASVQIHYAHPTFVSLLRNLGPINVYPAGDATDIKVEDIMNAIYHFFHQPITTYEWRNLPRQEQEQISNSYRHRIRQACDMREANGGLLRVDALKGCTRFAGLSITSHLNRSSQLYLNLLPL